MTALAVDVETTPESLREDARRLREEADRLRQESVKAMARAIGLEREADALEDAPAPAPVVEAVTVSEPSDRAVLAGQVSEYLATQREGKAISDLADHFGVSQDRMRYALALAIECDFVRRTGLKRGTRYHSTELPDGTPTPFGQSWHERVRDVAVELEVFTFAQMRERLPMLSEGTLRRWLRRLVEDGKLEATRDGTALIYAYVPPPVTAPPSRPKAPAIARRRSGPISGTSKTRSGRRDVTDLLRAAERQGAAIVPQKHGYAVVKDGEVVDAIARTPSDHRAVSNFRAKLKAKGLDV